MIYTFWVNDKENIKERLNKIVKKGKLTKNKIIADAVVKAIEEYEKN